METLKEKIRNKKAKICVVGLGYVGLPTAVYFAAAGFSVIGVDIDNRKVKLINRGISPIKDAKLNEKLKIAVKNGNLKATTSIDEAGSISDVIIIVVPTPVNEAKEPDLKHIVRACREVSKILKRGRLVILESTVYPGVTEDVVKPILEESGLKAGEDFGLAYVPERYNPGDENHTLEKVTRIVGGITVEWSGIVKELYQTIVKNEVVIVKNIKTAEAAKVIENIQRDLNIALMNELALIFERMGIDVIDVIEAASTKWNFVKYYPGAGVGGHCLPHDPYYLTKKAQELGYIPKIILAGRSVNDAMPYHVYELVADGLNKVKKPINGSKILILGASYKGDTGDLRTSPTEALVKELKRRNADVTIIEPFAEDSTIFGCPAYRGIGSVGNDFDAVVLMTAHSEFKKLDLKRLKLKLRKNDVVFVDGRRVFKPENVKKYFVYRGIGAGDSNG
jgi:nucleotide sugar dehydrogenase